MLFSTAADYQEKRLSLDERLIQHPAATFFVRAQGTGLEEAGIFHGDTLVVDRALKPQSGDIVMCLVDGELSIKTLVRGQEKTELNSLCPPYTAIPLQDGQVLEVWGVVLHTIHTLRQS